MSPFTLFRTLCRSAPGAAQVAWKLALVEAAATGVDQRAKHSRTPPSGVLGRLEPSRSHGKVPYTGWMGKLPLRAP